MQATKCVLFCLNSFCREVHVGCLSHDKKDSEFAAHISLDKKLKDQSRELLSLFYTIKEIFLILCDFFSLYTEPAALLMKFHTRVYGPRWGVWYSLIIRK